MCSSDLISLLLSIPVSMLTSSANLGRLLRRMRLFTTPEEVRLPQEYEDIETYLQVTNDTAKGLKLPPEEGFVRAAVDPGTNTLHRVLLRGPRRLAPEIAKRRDALLEKALQQGPDMLTKKEKKELLYDGERMARLHEQIWELPRDILAARWKVSLN